MGPPGAGKGTQAERLAEAFGMTHLSSGDIFRAEKASGSELGRQMAAFMDAGELVPDEVVVEVMVKAVMACPDQRGLLLDGFPRTVRQAESLTAELDRVRKPLDAVVVITAADDLIVERITGRRSCPKCGKVYHVRNMPPKAENVCDICGEELIHRSDDVESVVRERLATYYRQTEPVIAYYRGRADLAVMEFDGSGAPEAVGGEIVQSLSALASKC